MQQAGHSGSGAWSISDSKCINHSLSKPGHLSHRASQSQLDFKLTVNSLHTLPPPDSTVEMNAEMLQVQQAGQLVSGAWSIPDSKRINHSLSKPGQLSHPASQRDLEFKLTVNSLQDFTVQVGK